MTFRVLLGIDAIAAAIIGYFFLVGLADGSVSSFNIELWIGLLLGVAAIFAIGIALRRAARPALANLVLSTLAIPTVFYGLFILTVILAAPRWN